MATVLKSVCGEPKLPKSTETIQRIGANPSEILPPCTIGDGDLRRSRKLSLLCSRTCPGSIIVQALDAVRSLRGTAWTVVSGFQSPIERECLEILLRGAHPVIVCPARTVVRMRLPAAWKSAITAGHMLITSPFDEKRRRTTAALAEERNRFVVSITDAVFIPHAAPDGVLARLCQDLRVSGKPLWTLDNPSNAHLVEIGFRALKPDKFAEVLSPTTAPTWP